MNDANPDTAVLTIGICTCKANNQSLVTPATITRAWILAALPVLIPYSLAKYSDVLLGEGFDSAALLEAELQIGDLDFMKTAHRRAIVRL